MLLSSFLTSVFYSMNKDGSKVADYSEEEKDDDRINDELSNIEELSSTLKEIDTTLRDIKEGTDWSEKKKICKELSLNNVIVGW